MLTLCLRAVLISSLDTWDWTRMNALVVMHRQTLCENVDSAKIKVSFYTTEISIFYTWHWCIVLSYIVSIYRWIVTPLVQTHSLYLNLDWRHISLANQSYNASHNLVLQLYLTKPTLLCFGLGWTNNFSLDGTTATLIICFCFCHGININIL